MNQQKGWSWILILGLFYLGLVWLSVSVTLEISETRSLREGAALESEFSGNDWVTWKDTDEGVIASRVHPLPSYKPTDKGFVQEGDRLLKIGYWDILNSEQANSITSSVIPGNVLLMELERVDLVSFTKSKVETLMRNGFRLTFSFNDVITYWHVIGWLVGIGAFVALVMLAILLPVVRSKHEKRIPLMGIVTAALLFFLLQLVHHIYLIIESDLTSVGFEKAFILGYLILLMMYSIFYFLFRGDIRNLLFLLPSVLVGGWILFQTVDLLYISHDLKYFHELLEETAGIFFLLHLGAAVLLHLSGAVDKRWKRTHWGLLGVAVLSVIGLTYYYLSGIHRLLHPEHVFFIQILLLFFPLVNATFLQLQFGKVSLVITQTIQYIVTIVVSVVLYLLIVQLFDYVNAGVNYRRILEFMTFILGMIGFRVLYRANESKLRKYFVTTQQEKLTRFRNFIARIPQYTNSALLRKDIIEEVQQYFQVELSEFWWSGSPGVKSIALPDHQKRSTIYEVLHQKISNWSKTKELEALRLENPLEAYLLEEGYHLVCPVTVDEDNFALLMLGRKRRGVYNLSDIELMSQLIQQTQLTLNVLQLVTREKELIQQTYEANLTALRSQINPHFLFNTLNSIGELVHESADLAESAVEKLAFIFRYTLNKSTQNFVPLSEEMRLITTYLDLEKIRFGERLSTEISVDPMIKDTQIPAFILQTLVENCIKHGIAKILHKGRVSIEARQEDSFLVCDVYDNGPGIDITRIFKSTGLSNSIARMENLYEQKNLLQFENTGDGTLVKMRVPLVDDRFSSSEE